MTGQPTEVKSDDPDAILIDADDWAEGWLWRPWRRPGRRLSANWVAGVDPASCGYYGMIIEAKPCPEPAVMVELPLDVVEWYARSALGTNSPRSLYGRVVKACAAALAAHDAET